MKTKLTKKKTQFKKMTKKIKTNKFKKTTKKTKTSTKLY